MPQFSVPINGPNGPGTITVNASDAASAVQNASQGGNVAVGPASSGGNQNLNAQAQAAVTGSSAGVQNSTPASPVAPQTTDAAALQRLIQGQNSLMNAIASGNQQAFQEAVRQFDKEFGLDQQRFAEGVRQYNEGLAVTQAGLTGTYQGAPTMQAQQQAFNQAVAAAGLTGTFMGAQTQAAQQQAFAQQLQTQQQALAAQQQAYSQGTGLVQQVSQLQANPFRQQAAMGQLSRLLGGQSVAGQAGINAVPGAGTGGLGYLQQMIDDIREPAANQATTQNILNAIPTPNKLDSVNFFKAPTTTQNLVLSGMQEKYGIDPQDALAQIKNTMPGFQAPQTYGTVRRPTF